jgi:hypothetical protein
MITEELIDNLKALVVDLYVNPTAKNRQNLLRELDKLKREYIRRSETSVSKKPTLDKSKGT